MKLFLAYNHHKHPNKIKYSTQVSSVQCPEKNLNLVNTKSTKHLKTCVLFRLFADETN